MKTVEIKIFEFDELSDKAKQAAIEWYRNSHDDYFWADENRRTMEAFAKVFPVKVTSWSYGGRGEGVNFRFTESNAVCELSGQRLATYIWNNYRNDIFEGKYYGKLVKAFKDGSPIPTSKEHPIGTRHVKRHSKVFLEHSCVLTGYCMDEYILDPIYNFLDKPDNRNFEDLLEDCFSAWIKACNDDMDYQNSDEYITEEIKSQDWMFMEDGEIFNQSEIAS